MLLMEMGISEFFCLRSYILSRIPNLKLPDFGCLILSNFYEHRLTNLIHFYWLFYDIDLSYDSSFVLVLRSMDKALNRMEGWKSSEELEAAKTKDEEAKEGDNKEESPKEEQKKEEEKKEDETAKDVKEEKDGKKDEL